MGLLFAAVVVGLLAGVVGSAIGKTAYEEDVADAEKVLAHEAENAGLEIDEDGNWVPAGTGAIAREEAARKKKADSAARKLAFDVEAADTILGEGIAENVAQQGENQRQSNRQYLGTAEERERTTGAAAAKTAQGNVRKTGSASNLLSENVRMYNMDLEEIDKTLDVTNEGFARGRERLKTTRNLSVEAAKGNFEDRLDTFEDVDVTQDQIGGMFDDGDFNQGSLDSFMENLDLTPTIMTEGLADDLDWMQETTIDDLDEREYRRAGFFKGFGFGFSLIK